MIPGTRSKSASWLARRARLLHHGYDQGVAGKQAMLATQVGRPRYLRPTRPSFIVSPGNGGCGKSFRSADV